VPRDPGERRVRDVERRRGEAQGRVPQIALGLLGLLSDLGGDSTSEQREKVRISSAYQNYAKTAIVTRVRLDYPPHPRVD
jgi:hypothetical protein